MLSLHNQNPEMYSLRRITTLSNLGLAHFSSRAPDACGSATGLGACFITDLEMEYAQVFGFSTPFPLPGGMFVMEDTFMQHNFVLPMQWQQQHVMQRLLAKEFPGKKEVQGARAPPAGAVSQEQPALAAQEDAQLLAGEAAQPEDEFFHDAWAWPELGADDASSLEQEDWWPEYGSESSLRGEVAERSAWLLRQTFQESSDFVEEFDGEEPWEAAGATLDAARPAVRANILRDAKGAGAAKGTKGAKGYKGSGKSGASRGRGRGSGAARGGLGRGAGRGHRANAGVHQGGAVSLHWPPRMKSKAVGSAGWVEEDGQQKLICVAHLCHPPDGAPASCKGNCIRDPSHPLFQPGDKCDMAHLDAWPSGSEPSLLTLCLAVEYGGFRGAQPRLPMDLPKRQQLLDVMLGLWREANPSVAAGMGSAVNGKVGVACDSGCCSYRSAVAAPEDVARWLHPDGVALSQLGAFSVGTEQWLVCCFGSDMLRSCGSLRVESCVFLTLGMLYGFAGDTAASIEQEVADAFQLMAAGVPNEFEGLYNFCKEQVLHSTGKPISVDMLRIAAFGSLRHTALVCYHHSCVGLRILVYVPLHGEPKRAVEALRQEL